MDELEFCIKSMSYPLGMLLEGSGRRHGEFVRVTRNCITLPEIPFAALCYLTGIALYDSLDFVDKKRLQNDYRAIERFRRKMLGSKLGDVLRPYIESPGRHIFPGERLAIDWLEFEARRKKVEPYLERIVELEKTTGSREGLLKGTEFLGELSPDQGLLLVYIAEDEKLRGLINAALGKNNPQFREAVIRYFKALQG
ncbi:hypothetical protein [Thermococcus aciditolerans]|uniref:Uncharacterized protein n=1 Tax=Thermococcus aciditolerans TaxID=2598455 RepID=A0A5C0SLH3_9EURY|nr:hypothetical protein [Thermococcus aciditolerans]QEK14822.1 hypothetical protein FPV09_06610 [Thermococcus aciditolerans]